jgi:hypothetical protein
VKLVEVVKGLMASFWHHNTKTYSNIRDVLKYRKDSRDRESHIQHYTDMTKTTHEVLKLG